MSERVPIRVQHKRMTKEEWSGSSVILLEGELGVESDTGYVKVGDGQRSFADLAYMSGPKGDRGEPGQTGERGPKGVEGPRGLTGERGPKGEPFRYEDLSREQKAEIRGAVPDLSIYARQEDLAAKADANHHHDEVYLKAIPEEYVTEDELSAKGFLTSESFTQTEADRRYASASHTHTEYQPRGDYLTKAEARFLYGSPFWVGTQADYDRLRTKKPQTVYLIIKE